MSLSGQNKMNAETTPAVVTSSVAQVPKDVASQLGIEILPLPIYVNGKEHQDGIDLFPSELYQKMRADKVVVKTAAPSVGQYYQCFKKFLEQGHREILCIALSSKLSADYSSAENAANLVRTEYPDSKIVVFDSLCAAVPQGLLAIEAAQRLTEGVPLDVVVDFLDSARRRTGLIAAVDTLEYLSQGGRIGKAAYLLGSALHILPILTLNEEGIVAPVTILRQKNRVIPTIVSILKEQTNGYRKIRLAVMHADALDRAETLQQSTLEAFPAVDIPIDEFTPVMGAHAGPGLIGLGYLYE